jgi:hypothetical protein
VLQLAEKYGRSPEEVESWDSFWFDRAAVALEAESIDSQRRASEISKRR